MNTALRKVALATLVLFGLLFVNVNYVQVVAAERLRTDPRNGRVLLEA
jgi:peptidoglycan glycosyltransferase